MSVPGAGGGKQGTQKSGEGEFTGNVKETEGVSIEHQQGGLDTLLMKMHGDLVFRKKTN